MIRYLPVFIYAVWCIIGIYLVQRFASGWCGWYLYVLIAAYSALMAEAWYSALSAGLARIARKRTRKIEICPFNAEVLRLGDDGTGDQPITGIMNLIGDVFPVVTHMPKGQVLPDPASVIGEAMISEVHDSGSVYATGYIFADKIEDFRRIGGIPAVCGVMHGGQFKIDALQITFANRDPKIMQIKLGEAT